MADDKIFRKSSLEKLSTPEQLDYLMQVTTPKGWYALYTLCGLLMIAVLWSIFGRLPTTITGRALIMPPGGVDEVYSREEGTVHMILVKEGDHIDKGQVVARLRQKMMTVKGERTQKELTLKISSTRSSIRFLTKEVASKREALSGGLIPPSSLEDSTQALAAARTSLKAFQNAVMQGDEDLLWAKEVRANTEGIVVEILATPGTLITRGDPLMTYVSVDHELNAIAFIPEIGNEARPGMRAQVSPATIKKQEFGFIVGTVNYVSDFPARTHMMYDLTRNRILNNELTAAGAPYIVKITLEKNPDTYSGYRWSSSGGPKKKIKAGMMATVRIVVREQRPITMVIPALKKFLGI